MMRTAVDNVRRDILRDAEQHARPRFPTIKKLFRSAFSRRRRVSYEKLVLKLGN